MPIVLPAAVGALPFASPMLTEALSRLRQDIFDQAGPSPRWQDSDLQRAIDRALDRYSFVAPFVQTALIEAVGGSRLYALPPAVLVGPAWWVEAIEFPTNQYPRVYVPYQELVQPGLGTPAAPAASPANSGPITGQYSYRVTFVGIAGETASSPASNAVSGVGFGMGVTLPLGPSPYTRARNLYRTLANGADGTQRLVATIADNATTSYVDQASDASIGGASVLPVADTTANAPIVELRIPDSKLPDPANPGQLAATFGSKHVWATNGTTLPEQHHDIVLLGAAAYACLAYQVPTNDLFEYQDGELRDRVSEIKTPEHWQAAGMKLLSLFEGRLEEVKRQRDAAYAATAQWGSVPSRWQWT